MGRRGRKREPAATKAARGTNRTNRHGDSEPITTAPLTIPEWLVAPLALESWHWLVPMLEEAGLLAGTDADTVARYCDAVAEFRLARQELEEQGRTVQTGHGPRNHPAWARRKDAAAEMHRLSISLGLSPSDRAALGDAGFGQPAADDFGTWQAKLKVAE